MFKPNSSEFHHCCDWTNLLIQRNSSQKKIMQSLKNPVLLYTNVMCLLGGKPLYYLVCTAPHPHPPKKTIFFSIVKQK